MLWQKSPFFHLTSIILGTALVSCAAPEASQTLELAGETLDQSVLSSPAQQTSFQQDELIDSVAEFNGALRVQVPVFALAGAEHRITYESSGELPNEQPIGRAGLPRRWSRTWFGRLVHTPPSATEAGYGAYVEYADGSRETVLQGVAGDPSPRFARLIDAQLQGRNITSRFGTWRITTQNGQEVFELRQNDGTLLTFGSGNCFDEPGCHVTNIESLTGRRVLIDYYRGTGIPRVVRAYAQSGQGFTLLGQVYFYLDSNAPLSEPVDPGDLNAVLPISRFGTIPVDPYEFVRLIRYSGPHGSPQQIDQTWLQTSLDYYIGSAPPNTTDPLLQRSDVLTYLSGVRGADADRQTYRFEYYGGILSFPHGDRLWRVGLPSGSTIEYRYGERQLSAFTDHLTSQPQIETNLALRRYSDEGVLRPEQVHTWNLTGVVSRSIISSALEQRPQYTWDFAGYVQPVTGGYYQASAVRYPNGTSTIRLFHPLGRVGSRAAALGGQLVEERHYAASVLDLDGSAPRPLRRTQTAYATFTSGVANIFWSAGASRAALRLAWLTLPSAQIESEIGPTEARSWVTLLSDEAFGQGNFALGARSPGRRGYDQYGNSNWSLRFAAQGVPTVVRPPLNCFDFCTEPFTGAQMCSTFNRPECSQEEVSAPIPSDPELVREVRTRFLIDGETSDAQIPQEDYLALNLTQLPIEVRQCQWGTSCTDRSQGLLSLTQVDYDHRTHAYPFGSPTQLMARGLRTFQSNVDLDNPALSSTRQLKYYGPSDEGQLTFGLAEVATFVRDSEYQRNRLSYARPGGPLNTPVTAERIRADGTAILETQSEFSAGGLLLSQTDGLGRTVHHCHDRVGRLRGTFGPTDSFDAALCRSLSEAGSEGNDLEGASIEYSWSGAYRNSPAYRLTTQRVSVRGHRQSQRVLTLFDALGRPFQLQTEGRREDGSVFRQVIQTAYLAHTSQARISFAPQEFNGPIDFFPVAFDVNGARTETQFDSLLRPISESTYEGGTVLLSQTSTIYGDTDAQLGVDSTLHRNAENQIAISRSNVWGEPILNLLPGERQLAITRDALGRATSVTHPDGEVSRYQYSSTGRLLSQSTPEAGETRYEYDGVGQTLASIDANGLGERYTYDDLGRLTAVTDLRGVTVASYQYDNYTTSSRLDEGQRSNGRLQMTQATFPAGQYDYGYDRDGRLTAYAVTLHDLPTTKVLTREYDPRSGLLLSQRYSGGEGDELDIALEYDANLDVQAINSSGRALVRTHRDFRGQEVRSELLMGQSSPVQVEDYTYDAFGGLRAVNDPENLGNDAFAIRLSYEEGAVPRRDGLPSEVEWASAAFGRSRYAFGYDAASQMTAADFSQFEDGAWRDVAQNDVFVRYDSEGANIGNITQMSRGMADGTRATTDYQYDGRTLLGTDGDVQTDFAYDAAGNVTENSEWGTRNRISYDSANRPRSVTGQFSRSLFQNDAFLNSARTDRMNLRLQIDGVRTEHTVRGPAGEVLAQYQNGRATRIEVPGLGYFVPPSDSPESSEQTGFHAVLTDHVGSVRAVVNETGAIVDQTDFDPWGQPLTGNTSGMGRRRFAHYTEETELGESFYFANARLYHPGLGRFLSADQLAEHEPLTTAYAYARNAPSGINDPTGLTNDPPLNIMQGRAGSTFFSSGAHWRRLGGGEVEMILDPWSLVGHSGQNALGNFAMGFLKGVAFGLMIGAMIAAAPFTVALVVGGALAVAGGITLIANRHEIAATVDRFASGTATSEDYFNAGEFVGGLASGRISRIGRRIRASAPGSVVRNGFGPSPALKGSPYAPEVVAARVRPPYRANPAHDPNSRLFNPRKTPEPDDAAGLYEQASRGSMTSWFAKGRDGWYQYFSDDAGGAHFAGTVARERVPIDIRRAWGE